MGKRLARQLDDDYFKEPDYDRMSDEELDDLYHFGEVRSAPKRRLPKPTLTGEKAEIEYVDISESWLDDDMGDDMDNELDDSDLFDED